MRESRTGGGERKLPYSKPVEKIELSQEHKRLRVILAVVFLLVAAIAFSYGVINLSSRDPGWAEIEAVSSESNCGSDFVFLYCLGQGEASATAEGKALTACYSEAVGHASQIFAGDAAYENVHNPYYINRHPNEEMEVDDSLYEAFSLIQESGDRSLYLGPVYEYYNGLFYCTEEYQTVDYDPYRNPDIADYYASIVEFAADSEMIDLELLGDNRIRLRVADAYLAFAAENEIEDFIDFYWMKNAFLADYLAEELLSAGYSRGVLSSVDGFTRNLDSSEESYSYTFFDREDSVIYPAASVQYTGPASIVYLRDYGQGANWQYTYAYSNGELRTAYLDVKDGLCRSAVSDLACYSAEYSCGEILLRMIPVYIADALREESLTDLAEQGIFSICGENGKISYTDADLTLTSLYRQDEMEYEAVLMK